ncbi:MAG: putative porin, partial [Candidatus Omnitrophica bacterium]|nr:putative porin [Candidatus Omnitrophota bacterium]
MIKKIILAVLIISLVFPAGQNAQAGEIDILVRKLVEKKILTQDEATGILEETRQEAAKEAQNAGKVQSSEFKVQSGGEVAKGTQLATNDQRLTTNTSTAPKIPDWTERITMKGDARFRTQGDWGKGLNPAHSEIRERMRLRLGAEGKVNDQVYGGARLATGSTADPRSTNITLGNGTGDFSKTFVMFDQYYIRLEPKLEYIDKTKIWLGKFPNPLNTTDILWDSDINPEGIGLQYSSPKLDLGDMPETNLYANAGMLWLQEIQKSDND